jgi:predicted component of type VI protein secretion system
MSRVRFATTQAVFEPLPEMSRKIRVAADDQPPIGFLKELVAAGRVGEAVTFSAYLEARQTAKRLSRSSHQTAVQAVDNTLKFATDVKEALRIMLGQQTASYLDARRALEQGFDDLKGR